MLIRLVKIRVIVHNSLTQHLFSLSHTKKATARKKPEAHDAVETPINVLAVRGSRATMAVLAYRGLTAGPKLLRDRRSSTGALPPSPCHDLC